MEPTTKLATFSIPVAFEPPQIFYSRPEDVARALTLGAIAFETIEHEGKKTTHEILYAELKTQASKEYEPQLQSLKRKLEETTLETTRQYEPQLQALQKQTSQSSEQIASLKSRLQLEETARLDLEKKIREEERRNREEIMKEKDSRISALEQQVKLTMLAVEQTLKESSKSMTEGFQTFKEQIIKTTAGSQKKGATGEAIFESLVQSAFGSVGNREVFTLENVGKEGHQGDLLMNWKGNKILWEVKNYGRAVSKKEVQKFQNDMELNKDISLGVMVSLTTGITEHQKSGNIDLEELRDGRMCIYINNLLSNDDPITILQSLKPFMETFLQHRKPLTVDENSEVQNQVEKLEHQRTILLRLLNNHQESTRKFKNIIANGQKKHNQIWVEISTEMRQSENQVKLLLDTLLDRSWNSSETNETMDTDVEIPDYVFRHADIELYNDKERKFIMDTIAKFEFSEEYSVPTKVVKETYKELGYNEDFVNAMRPRVFLDDVWEKGTKNVKFMRRV